MNFFFITIAALVLLASTFASAAGSGSSKSGWNIDSAAAKVSAARPTVVKAGKTLQNKSAQLRRQAKEKSKVLKAKARTVRESARSKAKELLAQAKGQSTQVQASNQKRAQVLLEQAKKEAKNLEEKAKQLLANVWTLKRGYSFTTSQRVERHERRFYIYTNTFRD